MPEGCQTDPSGPVVLAIAGPAGSGKTTLGRAAARALGFGILDLDELTNPLLDALDPLIPGPHWLASPQADLIRAGRYAALRSAAADIVGVGRSVVLVAPFTAELRGGAAWEALVGAVAPAPLQLVYLAGPPELLAGRRRSRGSGRDVHRPVDPPPLAPSVGHLRVDAALDTGSQLVAVLQALQAQRVGPR